MPSQEVAGLAPSCV